MSSLDHRVKNIRIIILRKKRIMRVNWLLSYVSRRAGATGLNARRPLDTSQTKGKTETAWRLFVSFFSYMSELCDRSPRRGHQRDSLSDSPSSASTEWSAARQV